MSLLQNSNAISSGGYNLESSLRFRSSASAYLERTPTTAGNRRTWTWSAWVKRGTLGANQTLFASNVNVGTGMVVYISASDTLTLGVNGVGVQSTNAVFRDPSAWYHIVFVLDTTQATQSNRFKLYVNGVQQTFASFTLLATQNQQFDINNTLLHTTAFATGIGSLDGYITEFNFIDGQALTPSDFGETDTTTGVWKPKEYLGTYGTNGFYLPMKETQQATGFNTVLYTGTGAAQSINNVGFSPDLVWFKRRTIDDHDLQDTVRGIGKSLITNNTNAEQDNAGSYGISSFNSDGFSLVGNGGRTNESGGSYTAWCWDAGSSTVSNTDGTITSSVRANPATGFSIVTYTGTGANATVGHGLGVAPSMIIVKCRTQTSDWPTYHVSQGATKYANLNETSAFSTNSAPWNNTAPTSSVFTVGTSYGTNWPSNNLVAYCFAEVSGYSKFGSYTGNGSTSGPTVTTGFRPAFVLWKRTDTAGESWYIVDSTRDPDNNPSLQLRPNLSDAETSTTNRSMTFTDTGFQVTGNDPSTNESGGTYIYMAFADTRDAQFNFDASGNKNNWTANNINSNASSETTYDIMNDVATLTDEDTANFATLNPIYAGINGLSASNLTFTPSGWMSIPSTIALPTDSTTGIYWEETLTTAVAPNYHASGLTNGKHTASTAFDSNTAVISMSGSAWRLYKSGDANNAVAITGAGGSSASNGDVHMFAYKNGYLYWGINGSWYPTGANPATDTSPLNASQITSQQYVLCGAYSGVTKSINFGQRPFKYTPPTGFKKLNTYNLPDSTIKDGSQYFASSIYTGTGASQAVSNGKFSPDLLWIKARSSALTHNLWDTVRGLSKYLASDSTAAEVDFGGNQVAMYSDGFGVGPLSMMSTNSVTYVAWQWKLTPDSGFDIATYVGNGSSNSFAHNLGVRPAMVIVKSRDGSRNWFVYHQGVSTSATASQNYYLNLNGTGAAVYNASNWIAVGTSGISLGLYNDVVGSGENYIAYCFAEIEGFSKFGSYTGNGSTDGPFVYTGFRPAFVLMKRSSNTGDWWVWDTTRNTYNVMDSWLYPNGSYAEFTANSIDAVSNGFKVRNAIGAFNPSGDTLIYMAFAENPFKQSLAR